MTDQNSSVRLNSIEIQKHLSFLFGDILEYLHEANLHFDKSGIVVSAFGEVIFDPSSELIKYHTVGEERSVIVPGSALIESAARLLALTQVYSENISGKVNRLPRLRQVKKFIFDYEVWPSFKLYIKIYNIHTRKNLIKSSVDLFIDAYASEENLRLGSLVAEGELVGVAI